MSLSRFPCIWNLRFTFRQKNVQLGVGTITRWWQSTKLWPACCLQVPVCTLESLPYSQPTTFTTYRFLIFSVQYIQMVGVFGYRRERSFCPEFTENINAFFQKDSFWNGYWDMHLGTHSVTSLGKPESRFIIRKVGLTWLLFDVCYVRLFEVWGWNLPVSANVSEEGRIISKSL